MDEWYSIVERDVHVETVPEEMRTQEHAPLRRGRRQARHPLPLDAPQHQRLQRLRALQLRLPAPGEDERRHRLPAARRPRRRAHPQRLPRRPRAVDGARATGVRRPAARRPRSGKPRQRVFVRARHVVLSAGAMYTPARPRAQRHRARAPAHVGRNLTLHPSFRVIGALRRARARLGGRAPERVLRSLGARRDDPQQRLRPATACSSRPCPASARRTPSGASTAAHLAIFGGMLHDDGGGRVWSNPFGREPFMTYRMSKRDRARVPILLRRMAEIFFAAGATEVFLPVLRRRSHHGGRARALPVRVRDGA